MKKKHVLKALATAILLVNCMALYAVTTLKHMSYLNAVKSKQVSVTGLVSKGCYMGQCLTVSLHNNTNEALEVKLDPALIFIPPDTQFQNLVAVGEETISIKPGETKSQMLQTFCGKSYAHIPDANLDYKFWKQGDSTMIKTSMYINQHQLYSSLGQHAIWMFTNHHCLRTVYSTGPDEKDGKAFVAYLAKITHQSVPNYFSYHKINNTRTDGSVYDRNAEKIYVNIGWHGEFRRNIRVAILDKDKKLYQEIKDGEVINSNKDHHIRVEFDLKKVPYGEYYVQLRDDENRVWVEEFVIVGDDC